MIWSPMDLGFKNQNTWGPFHKSSYERVLLYEFVEPVLNYRSNEFVALTNLCETGPWTLYDQTILLLEYKILIQ